MRPDNRIYTVIIDGGQYHIIDGNENRTLCGQIVTDWTDTEQREWGRIKTDVHSDCQAKLEKYDSRRAAGFKSTADYERQHKLELAKLAYWHKHGCLVGFKE